MADLQMQVEFYHRHVKRMSQNNVAAIVSDGIASNGLVVDRLKKVTARKINKSYWRYVVPVMQVIA